MESWCQALKPVAKRSMDGDLHVYMVKMVAGGSGVMPNWFTMSCETK